MNDEIKLTDISDELLILNKYTIDTLFKLENCSDCIALYVFYYKTAKWQKTNTIKANDTYVKKYLKWGEDKVRRTKKILKENGLIDIVQSRKDGKISGWYIQVSYLVQQRKIDDVKIKVQESNNTCSNNTYFQELAESRSRNEETNALKEYIKCLEKELEMLKNKNKTKETYVSIIDSYTTNEELKQALNDFVEMRKKTKGFTLRALKLNLNTLDKLAVDEYTKTQIVNTTVMNGWKSFYPLKENTKQKGDIGDNWSFLDF